jgi:rRNA-processing protein FCF1
MRILIDTNIFIPLEDSNVDLDTKIAELCRLVSAKHELLLHPATIDDIQRDSNHARRDRTLARIHRYPLLESPPVFAPGEEVALLSEPKNANDAVDNIILLALHKNCVNWLISQDDGLHKKAKSLGQEERVLTVEQAVVSLSQMDSRELLLYPTIDDVPCHSISLKDQFFDSLRDGYGDTDFDKWFIEKCQQGGRRAWVSGSAGNIDAICIYKIENDPRATIDDRCIRGAVLKLCTFKVVKRGYKIGELLLKQAFGYAFDNHLGHVYVTVEPGKHEMLVELFEDFGFEYFGIDEKGRDSVYIKQIPVSAPVEILNALDYAVKYYPYVSLRQCAAYLVPIAPGFHSILFPEIAVQADFIESPRLSAGNAIKQAYLCNSNCKSIRPGDLLFFYRTHDYMAITSYGVVDQFYIENDSATILQWVSKRTVFSGEDIRVMAENSKNGVKVILFRLMGHCNNDVEYAKLLRMSIIKGPIQSITRISDDAVTSIVNEAGINDRFLPN